MYNNWLALVFLILTLNQQVSSFANTHEYYTIKRYISGIKSSSILQPLSSSNDDDWGLNDVDDSIPDNEDPRLQAMKSLLESSWDAKSMGVSKINLGSRRRIHTTTTTIKGLPQSYTTVC